MEFIERMVRLFLKENNLKHMTIEYRSIDPRNPQPNIYMRFRFNEKLNVDNSIPKLKYLINYITDADATINESKIKYWKYDTYHTDDEKPSDSNNNYIQIDLNMPNDESLWEISNYAGNDYSKSRREFFVYITSILSKLNNKYNIKMDHALKDYIFFYK